MKLISTIIVIQRIIYKFNMKKKKKIQYKYFKFNWYAWMTEKNKIGSLMLGCWEEKILY